MFLDCKVFPLYAMALLLDVALGAFDTLLAEPNFDPEPLELASFGSFVNEKAFALNRISKKRNSFKTFFRLIVFMGSDFLIIRDKLI